ncbi:MAG: hypothetical protein JSW55_04625, partial [Chloroflexota bacterium]
CRFRFPAPVAIAEDAACPFCRGPAPVVSVLFGGERIAQPGGRFGGPPVEVLLDNLRSSYNVGSILRTCDGAGVRHAHLCGITSTPDQMKVAKTALGADQSVPWTYHRNGLDTVINLKDDGYSIWSLENRGDTQFLFDISPEEVVDPVILVVGNELAGIDPDILAESDRVVSLPMFGSKQSLNAVVAFGAAIYWLRSGTMPIGPPL